jgi:uncharacterized protein YuzE
MKIDFDPQKDLMYISFAPATTKAASTVTIVPGVMADFDKHRKLIGIEVLEASKIAGEEIELGLPRITALSKG